MDAKTILAWRLRRQGLTEPLADPDGYVELFRSLQPVAPVYFSCPGDPPSLVHRTTFDEAAEADRLWARGGTVKGRFLGGGIGYVLAEDLALYANAFRKPLEGMDTRQRLVLETVRTAGPLTPRQLKEETGLLNKEIMPVLHRLQSAFLVFEDQVDSDWERSWSYFASEWPDVALSGEARPAAVGEVLRRFVKAHVFATFEQIRNWSQLPVRELKAALKEAEAHGKLAAASVEGLGEGWLAAEDSALPKAVPEPSVFMLHRSDVLVRPHQAELKRRFAGVDVLQYLLIDGEFLGAVAGHWWIGPHDVDDVVVELPARRRAARREEILAAVAQGYHPPRSRILKYAGRSCKGA